jgi:hypothetical protein
VVPVDHHHCILCKPQSVQLVQYTTDVVIRPGHCTGRRRGRERRRRRRRRRRIMMRTYVSYTVSTMHHVGEE